VFFPASSNSIIDAGESGKTIYMDNYKYIALGIPRLALSSEKGMFLIGSSNVREGFRPKELQPLFSDYEVHNLAVGGSNITQVNQEVRLLVRLLPEEIIKKSVFIVGVWYGIFVDDQTRWKGEYTNLAAEAVRSGLYKIDRGLLIPKISTKFFPYCITLLRPVLFFHAPVYKITAFIDNTKAFMHYLIRNKEFRFSLYSNNSVKEKINEPYKQNALKFFHDYMGTKDDSLKEEQFEELLELCDFINDNGAKLVIVDIPLPSWHSERSGHYSYYQRKKAFYIDRMLKCTNVQYINMQEIAVDSDFYDSAHPNPGITKEWSKLLKQLLNLKSENI
jgi:hypothetical protein